VEPLAFQAYGVEFAVSVADRSVLAAALPPGADAIAPRAGLARFDDADGIEALESALRTHVAGAAPDLVFVHAGVVAVDGRAIVVPGTTHAGKTTLVAELLRAGATYYSDELAVLTADGRVLPYAKPLALRGEDGGRPRVQAAELGAATGAGPAEVAIVARTWFEAGAAWAPAERSAADGVLMLLAHTGQARDAPERVLDAVRAATEGAVVLEGPRGEAAGVAADLLARARRTP